MQSNSIEQNELRAHLLNKLSSEQSEELEQRLLIEKELLDEWLIAEDQLIDDYLAQRLNEQDRERFESHFLAADERQRKLRFSAALRKLIRQNEESHGAATTAKPAAQAPRGKNWISFWFLGQPATAIVTLAVVLLGLLAWSLLSRPHTATNSSAPAFVVQPVPGITRGGEGSQRIAIPHNKQKVELELEIARNDYSTYRIEILEETRPVLTSDSEKVQMADASNFVIVTVDSKLLNPGDYQIKLSGITPSGIREPLANYSLRIVP
ncbi:MAG: hypothetical protein ABR555_16650 [Pyrinomonadaceae bacterium]